MNSVGHTVYNWTRDQAFLAWAATKNLTNQPEREKIIAAIFGLDSSDYACINSWDDSISEHATASDFFLSVGKNVIYEKTLVV